jgi:filamentous hemagglutinin family protein
VLAPGVNLDNRTVGAPTIVNEVITTNRSFIEEPVEILGSRAHLIIANPNGITVNSASFVSTGGVTLGAGTIALVTWTETGQRGHVIWWIALSWRKPCLRISAS